jgi:putative phosphoribosyl transferase
MRTLFHDRVDAGRRLASTLRDSDLGDAVVVGLARGGVPVAAEVARQLSLALDALGVRKVGHPWQPEYALGAVAPGGGEAFIRSHDDLGDAELQRVIEQAKVQADALHRSLHEQRAPAEIQGRTVVLVDDGLATGATMVAAVRWARGRGAARVVVAVPVGAAASIRFLHLEADEVVCPYELEDFGAVGLWYDAFPQVEGAQVEAILDELGAPAPAPAPAP